MHEVDSADTLAMLETWDWEIFCVEAETIMREKISRGTTEPGIVMNN